ncbi:ClpXP protease specificity-enhancing factor [Pseudorhodoferax sp. Leaf265]|uniref:ClpXP protease specificity-enhancing factor n=1 Tax=Pseudorhodoferax sp. Leaf265 TaxID=1736315 RepID=UPI0006F9C3F5|nr:ClpXP protease specificity-enhancing factor [Pseudorhodoferax sp. Leaf265]KQP02915.1 starvation protein B [Pseudorhodoferax sp. Leaf265]
MNALDATSTRPYLIRALYEWCTDNGFTPYIAVLVDETVQVPREYVKDGEIVLNVSFDATSALKLGNDFIEFKARFAGTAREILVPIGRVIAIYARENGQGMAFPSPVAVSAAETAQAAADMSLPLAEAEDKSASKVLQLAPVDPSDEGTEPEPPRPGGGAPRPALKRVK